MDKYRKSLFATAFIITIPSIFLLAIGIMKLSVMQVGFAGGLLVIWWGVYFYVRKGTRLAFWLSFALVNFCWWALLWRTCIRLLFIIENSGMERGDGYGSPFAFLIGFAVEQLFFLPLCFSMLFGVWVLRSFKKSL